MKRQFKIKLLLLTGCILMNTVFSFGQGTTISLEEAISLAEKHYPGLVRDQLTIEQQQKLAQAGMIPQSTQLFVTGEEFNFGDQGGIHSLNVQQNFYLPKAKKAERNLHQKGALVAEQQYSITKKVLKWNVEKAYIDVVYARASTKLEQENLKQYNSFLSIATKQSEAGETGKIPLLAARSRVGQADLDKKLADDVYQLSVRIFNKWLQAPETYEAEGELTTEASVELANMRPNNPHLQILQAERELAQAKVEKQESLLLPQLNTGLRLQKTPGNFPLYGYQAGLNIPLFRKSYNKKVEAAKIEILVKDAALENKQQELDRTISDLQAKLDQELQRIEYLKNELSPLMEEVVSTNLSAYHEGEISYLVYLDGLEQQIKVKEQYLSALYKFNILKAELSYWLGE